VFFCRGQDWSITRFDGLVGLINHFDRFRNELPGFLNEISSQQANSHAPSPTVSSEEGKGTCQSEPKTISVGRPRCTTNGNSTAKESSSSQTVTVRRAVRPKTTVDGTTWKKHTSSPWTNFERKRQIVLRHRQALRSARMRRDAKFPNT